MSEQSVTQIENPFGIVFVAETEVPDAPRKNERNDALWVAVKEMLKIQPNTYARVKVYNSATGAGQKAGAINNNRDKKFPSSEWSARYTTDRENDKSELFLAYVGK